MRCAKSFRTKRRRATTVVEVAVVMPLLTSLMFGTMEYGWMFLCRQTVTNAAHEGCRVAAMQGSTNSQITGTISPYLTALGLKTTDYTVTLTHYTNTNPTEYVTVSVPYSKLSLLSGFFGSTNWNITSNCSMMKEGVTGLSF